jgi:NAD(P)-dependent dehydrogenase (short-subunit alcohol dehydrogenase family)
MSVIVERPSYYAEAPIALVIGCGDLGIGAARALGQTHPLLIVNRGAERLERTIEALRDEGYVVQGRQCDVSDPEQVAALGAALGEGPGVRILAHVAAVGPSIGDWRKLIAINLIGPHLVAQAAGPHMVRGGAAIFYSSLGAYMCDPEPARDAVLAEPLAADVFDRLVAVLGAELSLLEAYNYSKRALIALAERLAVAWGPAEVRSLSLSPGMIETAMGRRDGAPVPGRNERVREIPLGRKGAAIEVSGVLAFLASDAARFVNGVDILVDGGHRAGGRRNWGLKAP